MGTDADAAGCRRALRQTRLYLGGTSVALRFADGIALDKELYARYSLFPFGGLRDHRTHTPSDTSTD
jgi:hypothetical protein